MIKAIIQREESSVEGTYGIFTVRVKKSTLTLHSLELPWKENAINVSSVRPGTYECAVAPYKNYMAYLLQKVPGRSGIFMHRMNRAGDESLGYKSDVRGCIGLGMGRVARGQKAITDSRDAFTALMALTGHFPMKLQIK